MSSNPVIATAATPASANSLEYLKSMANVHGSMARLYIKEWGKASKNLLLMSECGRYEFFCKNSVQMNAQILEDLECEALRECVEDVLKAQRSMNAMNDKVHASYKKSIEFDKKYWARKKELQEEAAVAEANASSST